MRAGCVPVARACREIAESPGERRAGRVSGGVSGGGQRGAVCVGGWHERERCATRETPYVFRLPRASHEHATALAHAYRVPALLGGPQQDASTARRKIPGQRCSVRAPVSGSVGGGDQRGAARVDGWRVRPADRDPSSLACRPRTRSRPRDPRPAGRDPAYPAVPNFPPVRN
jgi:hypothetical protein